MTRDYDSYDKLFEDVLDKSSSPGRVKEPYANFKKALETMKPALLKEGDNPTTYELRMDLTARGTNMKRVFNDNNEERYINWVMHVLSEGGWYSHNEDGRINHISKTTKNIEFQGKPPSEDEIDRMLEDLENLREF